MNIAFLGFGSFGQAIAALVEYNGMSYDYARRRDSRQLSGVADVLFLTLPTQSIRHALEANRKYITDKTVIVNCAKGIEEDSHLLVYQVVQEVLGGEVRYCNLFGPSFADEIISRQPTTVSLGYVHESDAVKIQGIVETPYFKTELSNDYQSLELAGALKNLYAITCGYAHGIGFGMNTRARIFTMALNEFKQLAQSMGFDTRDVASPGIAGDMMLTCNSEQSRNFRYGLRLAQGDYDTGGYTVEGYYTSHSIAYLAAKCNVKLPLAELTSGIIAGDVNSAEEYSKFLVGN